MRLTTPLRYVLLPLLLACALPLLAACGAGLVTPGDGSAGNDASVTDDAAPAEDLASSDLTAGPPCGTGFCKPGEVCEVGACHIACANNVVRCGEAPEVCCKAGDVCYLGACTTPGQNCVSKPMDGGMPQGCATTACPMNQYCEESIGKCLPLAKTGMCEYKPPVGAFAPVVKWEWQGSQVEPAHNQIMMTPMVGDLDGDCMPDIVFATFATSQYTRNGVLRAVRGDGKGELWNVTDTTLRVVPGAQVALADTDGNGKMEVYACREGAPPVNGVTQPGELLSFNHDGTLRWRTTDLPCRPYDAPFVADLNHDGIAEVVVGFNIFSAPTGQRIGQPAAITHQYTTAAELDGNPATMEIVGGGIVMKYDGSTYWNAGLNNVSGFPAVADLDGDGFPEVVVVYPGLHQIYAYKHDGTKVWGPVDVNNGVDTPKGPNGGGPPTIADFNGDGKPDVAAAGGYGYLILRGTTGQVLWHNTDTTDTSSRVTGSSVFDFEGDGAAEAVYNDEHNLRVYRGSDGKVLVKICSTSGTLYENPVIVDVDADDHADIVVMANNYAFGTCDQDVGGGASHTGFKVISDAQNRWVRTRRIWNQHQYHVTNVLDDGKIPKNEPDNWKQPGLNNFRQNVQTKNLFAAADLVPKDVNALHSACDKGQLVLVAKVVNQGAAGAPAGIPVTFYYQTQMGPKAIGTVKTTTQLLPGASQTVSINWTPPGNPQGPYVILVTVDTTGMQNTGVVNECDEDNNASKPVAAGCPGIG